MPTQQTSKNPLTPGLLFKCFRNFIWGYLLPDRLCLRILYKKATGKKLNLKNPKTFTEKLQWLKLHDRKPYYHNLVDKYEVKKIVGDIIGEEHIIKPIGVWERYDDIDFSTFPDQFVLKFTHDSGSTVVCKDKSGFNKDNYAWKYARRFGNRDYYRREFKEWVYKGVKPRIIAEPYLQDEQHNDLSTFEFYCCNGEAKCIVALLDKLSSGARGCFYDLSWNAIFKDKEFECEKPHNLELMKNLAEKIAGYVNNPFVRVDMYEVDNQVYFGEITFYPNAGIFNFRYDGWDEQLGSWIDLTKGAQQTSFTVPDSGNHRNPDMSL